MGTLVLEYRCLLISPGDVGDDRDALRAAVLSWNAHLGQSWGVRVELVGWDSHGTPDLSAPVQVVLNKQIVDKCDLGIALFWGKCGTRTAEYDSGSIEEIRRLQGRGMRVMAYFCTRPIPHEALRDLDQYRRLQEFRKALEKEGLIAEYGDVGELKFKVSMHLAEVVWDLVRRDREAGVLAMPAASVASSAVVEAAARPDVRVSAAPSLVRGAPGQTLQFVAVSIKNHSSKPVLIREVYLKIRDNRRLQLGMDALTGELNQRRALASGEGFEFHFSPADIVANVGTDELLCAAARDEIGHEYESIGGDALKRLVEELTQKGRDSEYTPQEAELLVAAGKAGGVLTRLSMDQIGSWVRAGNSGRNFVDPKDRTVGKRYLEALDRLQRAGLVTRRSPVWFELSSEGERVAAELARDELSPQWELDARRAIIELLEEAEWDFERKQVQLPSKLEPDGGASLETFRSYDALLATLFDAGAVAWHGSVPSEGSEAVFAFDDGQWIKEIVEAHAGEELRKMGWIEEG